jgi:Mg-chelatase subunit ChlD|tara:strand:- start:689 stop:3286 length:2598 start_codon:yes stop_codon:yes gene_type:complete
MKKSTPSAIATTFRGSRYRKMWQAAADGVYPQEHIPVTSAGARFFNQDHWTARAFVVAMCDSLKRGDIPTGSFPESHWIGVWTMKANDRSIWRPSIVVSATAEELTRRDRDAIAGGCYHEKGHTAYSCRRQLNDNEMETLLEEVWDLVPNWAPYAGTILQWGNLIEDIRIERLLQKDYAGTGARLAPLQDFVLEMEIAGKAAAEHRGLPVNEDLRVVTGAFRDLGLGYDTPLQNKVLGEYKTASPEAWKLVTEGDLKPFLDAAIALGDVNRPGDDLKHLSLAMKVIATLLAKSDAPLEDKPEGEGSEPPACEQCGAGVSKLRSRAVKGQPDKIAIVCTECGHKIIIDKPEKGEGGGDCEGGGIAIEDPNDDGTEEDNEGGGNSPQGPVIRADEEEEEDSTPDTGSDEGEDEGEGNDTKDGDDGTGEEAGDEEADGEDTEGDTPGQSPSDKEGEETEGSDEGDGEGDSDGDSDGDDDGETGDDTSNEAQDEGGKDGGAGAGEEQAPMTPEEIAAAIVDALEDGDDSGIKTHNEALDELTADANEKETGSVQAGEQMWGPYFPDLDEVRQATEGNRTTASALRNKARKSGGALKTMLRRKFLADRSTRRFHGVKRGKGLSERRLVDSAVEMAANVTPTRPDFADIDKRDCSLAAAIIVDQSGSMSRRRETAAIAMLALADGLDGVGAPVLCAGFRDIWHSQGNVDLAPIEGTRRNFHRTSAIGIDVFKGWEEPLRNCLVRFPSVQATGGTPMADGVQYGLQALSERTERHRILFVLTDGEPDHQHIGVMRRQIRLAREAGIEVVGIGIDDGCYGVMRTFEKGVAVSNIKELPKAILTILDEIVFPSRAKRVKLDGKFDRQKRQRKTG